MKTKKLKNPGGLAKIKIKREKKIKEKIKLRAGCRFLCLRKQKAEESRNTHNVSERPCPYQC